MLDATGQPPPLLHTTLGGIKFWPAHDPQWGGGGIKWGGELKSRRGCLWSRMYPSTHRYSILRTYPQIEIAMPALDIEDTRDAGADTVHYYSDEELLHNYKDGGNGI